MRVRNPSYGSGNMDSHYTCFMLQDPYRTVGTEIHSMEKSNIGFLNETAILWYYLFSSPPAARGGSTCAIATAKIRLALPRGVSQIHRLGHRQA